MIFFYLKIKNENSRPKSNHFWGFPTVTNNNSLHELNLINFEWYVPNTSGKTPNFRYDHQANVIEKYMVISFGKYTVYFKLLFNVILTKI